MAGIDIRRFLNNFGQNYTRQTFTAKSTFNAPAQIQTPSQAASSASDVVQNLANAQTSQNINQNMQLNTLQNIDRAVYAKEIMQFPKNLNEFIYMVQRGMTQAQFNQMFSAQLAAQRNSLSQMQAQILAQLQGLTTSTAKEIVNIQLASQIQGSLKNLDLLSGGRLKLDQISMLFQQNGKEAITKLIMSMTEASKAGINDLSQMKDMAKLINASISIASENNPQKTLKLLLMLYLPWLPLEDGVGFDLEVQQKSNPKDESDSVLTLTVTTINYGTIKAVLTLETSNSVQVNIEALCDFPKKELQLRIEGEQKHYSMESVLVFETKENLKTNQQQQKQSTNINMSQTIQINPYLLLIAHTIIKHIIDIDNNKTLGLTSHLSE